MRSIRELHAAVEAQARELRRKGAGAHLPDSKALLDEVARLLARDIHERQGIRLIWRRAALCHAAQRASAQDWAGSYDALDPIPSGLVWRREPESQTLDDVQARALMLVNRAFASRMLGIRASYFAHEALGDFYKVNNPAIAPWRGVACLIEATEQSSRDAQRACGIEALRHLDRLRQPELVVLAHKAAGHRSDSMYLTAHGPTRPAALQALECLYYFNE